jgi:hypothetical protein
MLQRVETYLLLNEIPYLEKYVKPTDLEYIKRQITEIIRDKVLIWLNGKSKIKELNIIGINYVKPPFPSNNIRFVKPGEVVKFGINVRTKIDTLKAKSRKRRNLLATYPYQDSFFEVTVYFSSSPETGRMLVENNFLVDREITDLPYKRKGELNDILEKNGYTQRIQDRKSCASKIIDLRQNW